MTKALLVFVGAGIGGALRHGVNLLAARLLGTGFPWGTLCVNLAGSFLMGAIIGILAARADLPWREPARLFLTTGVLGGFTTFSAFSLDTVAMIERGEAPLAALYAGVSVVGAVGALYAALALARTAL